jgi:hypothetical protein
MILQIAIDQKHDTTIFNHLKEACLQIEYKPTVGKSIWQILLPVEMNVEQGSMFHQKFLPIVEFVKFQAGEGRWIGLVYVLRDNNNKIIEEGTWTLTGRIVKNNAGLHEVAM